LSLIDQRLTRTCAHGDRPNTEHAPGHRHPVLFTDDVAPSPERVGGQGLIKRARHGFDGRSPKEVEKVDSAEIRARKGVPGEQLKAVAKMFATEKAVKR